MQMNKKSASAQKTKQRILKVAFKLFADKGYKHVTVDEIVKKARSSKGAFYNHFPSKDLLIYEHIKDKDERYATLNEEIAKLNTAADKLKYFTNNLFKLLSETPELSATLLTMDINHPEISAMFLDNNRYLYKLLHPIFEAGLSSGEIKSPLSVAELTEYLLTVTTGVEARWCIKKCSFDIVPFGNAVADVFIRGLVNEK
ncbi:MAG: TetR family transcriptional regulator [Bacillota bacterium]|nr:MAG: TetR family transcriptional regulator [Bacillota bacterium]MBS3949463.1 TetR/AcrR family transcriptional regulator [Peptococcaceae bacterium]